MYLFDKIKKQLISLKINKPGTQVYIISYPKSGRTWLRLMIGKAICDRYDLPTDLMIDTYELTKQAGLMVTHFSHDYSSILSAFSYQGMPKNKSDYADNKVIFLLRDIKDVLVSSYFQATKRTDRFSGTMSEFIRSDLYGVRKIVTFYNAWYEQQHVPQAFLLLRYEDMHEDTEGVLRQTLEFMGMPNVDHELVKTAVAFARFENMKRLERSGFFQDDKMRPADANDAESYKVRKGQIGGYRDYLSAADIAYVDQVIAEMGCPFLGVPRETAS